MSDNACAGCNLSNFPHADDCPQAALNACAAEEKWETLYRGCVAQLAALAEMVGNEHGDPEVTMGIVRDLRDKSAPHNALRNFVERVANGEVGNEQAFEWADLWQSVQRQAREVLKGDTDSSSAAIGGPWTENHHRAQAWLAEYIGRGTAAQGVFVEPLAALLADVRRETIEQCEAAAKAGIPFRAEPKGGAT